MKLSITQYREYLLSIEAKSAKTGKVKEYWTSAGIRKQINEKRLPKGVKAEKIGATYIIIVKSHSKK